MLLCVALMTLQVEAALGRVDEVIEDLIVGLKVRGIYDCVNVIVVSDHGGYTYTVNPNTSSSMAVFFFFSCCYVIIMLYSYPPSTSINLLTSGMVASDSSKKFFLPPVSCNLCF